MSSEHRGSGLPRRWLAALAALTLLPLGGVVLGGAAPAAAEPLGDCIDRDNGVPVVEQVDFSPSSVEVTDGPEQVTLRMRVVDHGGPGEASGVVEVGAVLAGSPVPDLRLEPAVGDWWSATFTVPQYEPPGTWRLLRVSAVDAAGNQLPRSVDHALHDRQPPFDKNLQVMSADPDRAAPALTSIHIGPRRVNTEHGAASVTISAVATDDLSGVALVKVFAVSTRHTQRTVLEPVGGDRFSGHLRIPRWQGVDTWRVRVLVKDRVGIQKNYWGKRVRNRGDDSFRVVSAKDTRDPVLKSVELRPRTVDIRQHADTVRFVVRAADRRSGVAEVRASLLRVSATDGLFEGVRSVQLTRTRGTARHGTWTGSTRLAPCTLIHPRTQVKVELRDRAGHPASRIVEQVLHVRAPDLFPPEASLGAFHVAPAGPVGVWFDEPVNGISERSAPVSGSDGTPLDGTWRCLAHDGTSTSCAAGRVRQARWTPQAPLATPAGYQVDLNPDGILELTDLGGTPCAASSARSRPRTTHRRPPAATCCPASVRRCRTEGRHDPSPPYRRLLRLRRG